MTRPDGGTPNPDLAEVQARQDLGVVMYFWLRSIQHCGRRSFAAESDPIRAREVGGGSSLYFMRYLNRSVEVMTELTDIARGAGLISDKQDLQTIEKIKSDPWKFSYTETEDAEAFQKFGFSESLANLLIQGRNILQRVGSFGNDSSLMADPNVADSGIRERTRQANADLRSYKFWESNTGN